MRVKLYRASSVSEAMAQLRAEMGPDALILSTRRAGKGVELTAASEETEDAPPPLECPAATGPLAWHGIPAHLVAQLSAGPLTAQLPRLLSFGTLGLEGASPRPLLVTGPPGAGKTLTVARLATRLVMAGGSPLVITTDGRRAGAPEQLAAFTRLLGLTLIVASHPATLARALLRRPPGASVLIDAPGANPFNPAQREEIAGLAATADATTVLTLPAGLDPAESADCAAAFAEAGATHVVCTRMDLARRLGSLVTAAHAGRLTLTEAGISASAAGGLAPLTPAFLAERLGTAGAAPVWVQEPPALPAWPEPARVQRTARPLPPGAFPHAALARAPSFSEQPV